MADMAGIIQGNQQPPAAPDAIDQTSPAAMRRGMKIPPDQADAYERIVLAGKKILYAQEMDSEISELMRGPGSVGEKIGQGVVALLAMLVAKTNGALPPQLIIPAGVELCAEAGDFLRQMGMKVSEKDIAEGIAVMIETILEKAGVSEDQLPQMLGAGAPAPEATPPVPGPAAPDGPPAEEV